MEETDAQQEQIRDLVRHMLEVTGLTATELAMQSGLAASTLTRFLNRPVKHQLTLKTLYKLSARSGVEVPAAVAGTMSPPGASPSHKR